MPKDTTTDDELQSRCPACKQVSHSDEWEVGGADPGYQFCPICSREVMPINLYLERLGAEQEGKINHDGPFKAQAAMDAYFEEMRGARAAAKQPDPPRPPGSAYGLTFNRD